VKVAKVNKAEQEKRMSEFRGVMNGAEQRWIKGSKKGKRGKEEKRRGYAVTTMITPTRNSKKGHKRVGEKYKTS